MTNDTVFIIVNKSNDLIESVWSTKKLAKSAIHYHAHNANLPCDSFGIIEREMNKANVRARIKDE